MFRKAASLCLVRGRSSGVGNTDARGRECAPTYEGMWQTVAAIIWGTNTRLTFTSGAVRANQAVTGNNGYKHSLLSPCNFLFALFGFPLHVLSWWYWPPRGWCESEIPHHCCDAINLSVTLPTLPGLAHNEKDGQKFCQRCSWEMETCFPNWKDEKDRVSSLPYCTYASS